MKKFIIFLSSILVCIISATQCADTAPPNPIISEKSGLGTTNVSGCVYVPSPHLLSSESYGRILQAPEVGYVLGQVGPGQGPDKETEKLRELAQNGKKIILQFIWGPGGRYNWSYHSLVALPFEEDVRNDLFEAMDKTIEAIGPKNIYAVHLMEECGWFGIDIDKAGDWRKNRYGVLSGWEDGNIYNNYQSKDCSWSPSAPNIKRQRDNFNKMTGLDLDSASAWGSEENFVFERWCKKVSALAEISFFNHIQEKYPGIKRFTWHVIRATGNPLKNSDAKLMRENIDGAIFDPYSSTLENYYNSFGPALTLYPGKEIIGVVYGGFDSENFRRERLTLAYLSGAYGLGFFEGKPGGGSGDHALKEFYSPKSGENMDYDTPEVWEINRALFRKFSELPVFKRKNSRILLIGSCDGHYDDAGYVYTGFKSIDIVPYGNEYQMDLSRYDLVIAHNGSSFTDYNYWDKKYKIAGPGLDYKMVETYVRDGGIVLLSGCQIGKDSPLFLSKYLYTLPGGSNISTVYEPEYAWQKKFGLEPSYSLEGKKVEVIVVDEEKVQKEKFGYLIPYGKGLVYYFPFYLNRQISEKAHKDCEDLLRDICRGLLELAGKKDVSDNFICPKGYNYFEVEDKNEKIRCYIWQGGKEFQVSGKEILTGDKDPVFGPERRAGIVLR